LHYTAFSAFFPRQNNPGHFKLKAILVLAGRAAIGHLARIGRPSGKNFTGGGDGSFRQIAR